MVAPPFPAAYGHLLRDRATIKAPVMLSPGVIPKKRALRPKKPSRRPIGAKDTKSRRAKRAVAATTTTAAAATTSKGQPKQPPKAIKYWMVLSPAGRRRIIHIAEVSEVPEDAISVEIVVPASHRNSSDSNNFDSNNAGSSTSTTEIMQVFHKPLPPKAEAMEASLNQMQALLSQMQAASQADPQGLSNPSRVDVTVTPGQYVATFNLEMITGIRSLIEFISLAWAPGILRPFCWIHTLEKNEHIRGTRWLKDTLTNFNYKDNSIRDQVNVIEDIYDIEDTDDIEDTENEEPLVRLYQLQAVPAPGCTSSRLYQLQAVPAPGCTSSRLYQLQADAFTLTEQIARSKISQELVQLQQHGLPLNTVLAYVGNDATDKVLSNYGFPKQADDAENAALSSNGAGVGSDGDYHSAGSGIREDNQEEEEDDNEEEEEEDDQKEEEGTVPNSCPVPGCFRNGMSYTEHTSLQRHILTHHADLTDPKIKKACRMEWSMHVSGNPRGQEIEKLFGPWPGQAPPPPKQ
ncbi:hypothetical protein BZA05DRAFT_441536 [Tricharina praecox]|uniref:uncharacterized protein n=1 Tax=Tricharina praecox TaxID=43433 RepID=UPI002220FDA5|nr:uncharacterized protein BZA05DRAFT_441536 [Tricharina praecox]KAI5856893.1 hypothetical protein BZA05DRAFT_441536 [Tricharina praecox]